MNVGLGWFDFDSSTPQIVHFIEFANQFIGIYVHKDIEEAILGISRNRTNLSYGINTGFGKINEMI